MQTAQPNVLYILADDLGWGDVGYHGSAIRTPNIDRLAQSGVELDRHYVCPLCTPTRAALLTGRFPSRFGEHATVPSNAPVLPDGYPTLASLFRANGYQTGLFGKWHLGSDPKFYANAYGFDYSYGSFAGGVDPYSHRYKEGPYSRTWHKNGELIDEQGHATDLITDEALSWLSGREGPWFCYVPYTAVHTPVKAPEAWKDRYAEGVYDPDPERDRSFKEYAAYASHMDAAVGRFVEFLKATGLRDNTIVVFASDNGAVTYNPSADTAQYPGRHADMPRTGSNYPLRGHKGQLYEGGIRTPAAISWPAALKPGRVTSPVHIADWVPTLAALASLEQDAGLLGAPLDGTDVSEALRNPDLRSERPPMYWNLRHARFAVRDGAWKLIRRLRKDSTDTELYDVEADPLEERDVAEDNPTRVQELINLLERLRADDDTLARPEFCSVDT
jgi:arylsulfatase A-like enzyme